MNFFLALIFLSLNSRADDSDLCVAQLSRTLTAGGCDAAKVNHHESGLGSLYCGKSPAFFSMNFENYNTWFDSHVPAEQDARSADPVVAAFREAWSLEPVTALGMVVTQPVCTSNGTSWWAATRASP